MPNSQPIRTCVGCRKRRPQAELVRVHLDDRGRVTVGRTGAGRGAWLCADTTGACLGSAVERKAFDRAFRKTPDRGSIEELNKRWPRQGNRA